MSRNRSRTNQIWEQFFGPNLGYAYELYESFQEDSESVDPSVKSFFEKWGPPPQETEIETKSVSDGPKAPSAADLHKVASAMKLIENIRTHGHQAADVYPLGDDRINNDSAHLTPERYGLNEEDLKALPADVIWEHATPAVKNGLEAVNKLKELYTRSIAFQFSHVHDEEEREWLKGMVEKENTYPVLTDDDKKELLYRLQEVEGFEQFLHKTFVGQKRFSIEGLDMLVPILDGLVKSGCEDGIENIMIGMAHRGRLNVLAHVLGKPYELILSEFRESPNKDLVPSEGSTGINYGWTGDVKYHLGAKRQIKDGESDDTVQTKVTLANNPSHLEFVNPVVNGFARAAQDDRTKAGYPEQHLNKAFSILIHGDAAFAGEGIVAETLNMSRLQGYETGGTIHIIANNLIGFTTERSDARSTSYASDLAKGYEIPIIRVNADDPEACMAAVHMAHEYRDLFKKDILIDLVGYRKYGHNEMDDPSVTQPEMYDRVKNHSTVATLYGEKLTGDGIISSDEVDKRAKDFYQKLSDTYENLKPPGDENAQLKKVPESVAEGIPAIKTAVPLESLENLNAAMLDFPEGFNVYPKLKRILNRRENALADGNKVDWAHAEALAFASIISEGKPIRITGQDSERGTFAHRHLVLHDYKTNKTYSPLHVIPQGNASFAIHNSPLSEAGVLGFEYGYSVQAPEALVLWEAQYGDFVNAGQVIIDQFISAGRAKWGQKSSLVMLLPHGYEGQGPEHSSGRPERFLTLAAENNWTVANLTSAAQYFHILRRQAAITEKDEARPLIIMTPKSLLRNPLTASETRDFTDGKFNYVFEQQGTGQAAEKVERLVLGTGKVMIDIAEHINKSDKDFDSIHVVRVEQIYPFPKKEIAEIISRFPNLKEVAWIQEEPKNMGSWHFVDSRLARLAPEGAELLYIGRPNRSSPAVGEPKIHKQEQESIISEALKEM